MPKINLNLKKNRIKICKECQQDAHKENMKAKEYPPENWNAEIWHCFRLRRNRNCPLGLPIISILLFGRPIDAED